VSCRLRRIADPSGNPSGPPQTIPLQLAALAAATRDGRLRTVRINDLWRGNLAMLGFSVGFYLPSHPEPAQPAAQGALEAIGQGLVDSGSGASVLAYRVPCGHVGAVAGNAAWPGMPAAGHGT
jgi:hypothetical protein